MRYSEFVIRNALFVIRYIEFVRIYSIGNTGLLLIQNQGMKLS